VAAALNLGDTPLLVGAGEPVPLPEGSDQCYPFRAHADYFYLAGLECPGGVVAFDAREGERDGWRSFVPDVTEGERVWEGRQQPPGESVAVLEAWLSARRGRPIAALGAAWRRMSPVPRRRASSSSTRAARRMRARSR